MAILLPQKFLLLVRQESSMQPTPHTPPAPNNSMPPWHILGWHSLPSYSGLSPAVLLALILSAPPESLSALLFAPKG